MHQAQHHVRHRRAGRGLEVQVAFELTACTARDEERAPLVIVYVRVTHRRAVHDHGLVQQ